MTQNAKQTTFTFDGDTIGGVEAWSLFQGQPREATFRPLDGTEPVSQPLPPEYGRCTLTMYYDPSDAGQAGLLSSLRNRTSATMVVTHDDGTTDTFTALCESFPISGSIGAQEKVERSVVRIRVSGYVD